MQVHPQPHQKHTERHKFVRNAASPTCTSKPWCTWEKGCCTYVLLTHAQPHQEHTKTHQLVRNTATPSQASRPWCILRVHSAKRVLHSLPVGTGAAAPETHKNTPICQKHGKATLCIKSMVHPEDALCKWVLHSLSVDAGAAAPETHKNTSIGQKHSKAALLIKAWCILRVHCHKWVLHL